MTEGNWGRSYLPAFFPDESQLMVGHSLLLVMYTPREEELEHYDLLTPEESRWELMQALEFASGHLMADLVRFYERNSRYTLHVDGLQGYLYTDLSPERRATAWLLDNLDPFAGQLTVLRRKAPDASLAVQRAKDRAAAREQVVVKEWLEIQAVDRWGRPVPNLDYEVVCDDGQRLSGKLGKDGKAEFRDIAPGEAEVRFANVHPDTWHLRSTTGEGPGWPISTLDVTLADPEHLVVPDQPLTATFEDGSDIEGTLDEQGQTTLTDLPSGPCQVEFTDFTPDDFTTDN